MTDLPEIPDAADWTFVREEFERQRAWRAGVDQAQAAVDQALADLAKWRAHIDEALHRLSTLPFRLSEMESKMMHAGPAAEAFAYLDQARQESVAAIHGRLDVVEPALATIAPEALPEVAARMAASARHPGKPAKSGKLA